MKKNCISVHGVNYEMELLNSDFVGFYRYKLIPMKLGYEQKIMYIALNRVDHWMYAKPMEGGMQIQISKILYFHTYK
jgi:hypothetical protein